MTERPSNFRRFRRWLVGIVIVLVVGVAFDRFFPADIRPDDFDARAPGVTESGLQRLTALRKAHGSEAWSKYKTMDVVFSDAWPNPMTRLILSPWDQIEQRLRGLFLRRSWNTELELLDGEAAGTRWGLQSWKTWTARPNGKPVFDESWTVRVTVAGLRYIMEVPLAQDTATFVADAGVGRWKGKSYERLYVTWRVPEPQRGFDQYLLWIGSTSGLVERVDFTIRAIAGIAVARATFEGFEDFSGVILPSTIAIDAVLPTGHTLAVHTIRIESVASDVRSPTMPDPSLENLGETKPLSFR